MPRIRTQGFPLVSTGSPREMGIEPHVHYTHRHADASTLYIISLSPFSLPLSYTLSHRHTYSLTQKDTQKDMHTPLSYTHIFSYTHMCLLPYSLTQLTHFFIFFFSLSHTHLLILSHIHPHTHTYTHSYICSHTSTHAHTQSHTFLHILSLSHTHTLLDIIAGTSASAWDQLILTN